ncbi:MAG: hypothetical protein OXI96_07905 [Acidimicrobiaceae bacterium]|nr:hypothetical protein [Acidimicrobiaceae bacterium]
MSPAATSELITCGANPAATVFIAPSAPESQQPMLPNPDTFGTYLSCSPHYPLNPDTTSTVITPRAVSDSDANLEDATDTHTAL